MKSSNLSRLSDIIFVITPICSGTTWAEALVEMNRAFRGATAFVLQSNKFVHNGKGTFTKKIDPVHNVSVQKTVIPLVQLQKPITKVPAS